MRWRGVRSSAKFSVGSWLNRWRFWDTVHWSRSIYFTGVLVWARSTHCSGNNLNKPTKPIRPWQKACRRHKRTQSRGTHDSGGNLRWEGGGKRDRRKEGEICSVCFYPNPQFKENLSLIQPNETQLWNLWNSTLVPVLSVWTLSLF